MDKFYTEKTVNSWDDAKRCFQRLLSRDKSWIFRGHQNSKWELKTTLERASRDLTKLSLTSEILTLDKFKSIAHNYLPLVQIPEEKDELQWFALMQHYGAPTRILDFTASPYIAAFFAYEEYEEFDEEADNVAVWAFNSDWLMGTNYDLLKDDRIEWSDNSPLALIGFAGLYPSTKIF